MAEPNIRPNSICLWFDTQAEEAANFYVSLIPGSEVKTVTRFPEDSPGQTSGVIVVEFTLGGMPFQALNGGPQFTFNESVSVVIDAHTQDEIDFLWDALTADGGEPSQCGWLKDKYGLSWQIVPPRLNELTADPDREKADRVVQAMLQMGKIDIAALEAAAAG